MYTESGKDMVFPSSMAESNTQYVMESRVPALLTLLLLLQLVLLVHCPEGGWTQSRHEHRLIKALERGV